MSTNNASAASADDGADEILAEIEADDYYAIVPEWVLFHPDLSHAAVRLYGVLRRFADQRGIAFPGLPAVGVKYGVDPRSVSRHMKELIAAGAVTKKRRTKRGKVTSNVYRIHSRPTFVEVQHAYTPTTSAATSAATKARKVRNARAALAAAAGDGVRTKMSDGSTDKNVRRSTDKNVRLTTATTNHSQGEPQTARGSSSVVVEPPVTREAAPSVTTTNKPKPSADQILTAGALDADGLTTRQERRAFRSWLRKPRSEGGRGIDNPTGLILSWTPEALEEHLDAWRDSLDPTAGEYVPKVCDHGQDVTTGPHKCPKCDPDRGNQAASAEPVYCDHGQDITRGQHMCPMCDPTRAERFRKRAEEQRVLDEIAARPGHEGPARDLISEALAAGEISEADVLIAANEATYAG